MKCIFGLLVVFTLQGSTHAKTLAYWRFEEGAAGKTHAADRDGFYKDSSGNGNHLSSWAANSRPEATAEVAFAKVPQTGKKNALALQFSDDNDAGDDLGTFSKSGRSMIDSFAFKKGWTIECTFKMAAADCWQVIIGKDTCPGSRGEPLFSAKIMQNNRVQIMFCDDAGTAHFIESITPVKAGEWNSIAVTYDRKKAELYLKRESDRKYFSQRSLRLTNVTLDTPAPWTIGRGMWEKKPTDWFKGSIDEVRISDTALDNDEFLAARR